MGQDFAAQTFPPSTKAAGRAGGLDSSTMLTRAEAAMKALSGQFAQWLNADLVKLDTARADIQAKGLTPETADGLYMRAHDLKGLGATYEFPLIGRMAGSLCNLLDHQQTPATAPLPLIDARSHAIKASVRDGVRTDADPVGRALAEALEEQVRAYLA